MCEFFVGVNVNQIEAERNTVVVQVVVKAKGSREESGRRLYWNRRNEWTWKSVVGRKKKKKVMSVVGCSRERSQARRGTASPGRNGTERKLKAPWEENSNLEVVVCIRSEDEKAGAPQGGEGVPEV